LCPVEMELRNRAEQAAARRLTAIRAGVRFDARP
jgi:hypothetical protein